MKKIWYVFCSKTGVSEPVETEMRYLYNNQYITKSPCMNIFLHNGKDYTLPIFVNHVWYSTSYFALSYEDAKTFYDTELSKFLSQQ